MVKTLMTNIAVILPSRGLMFSQTADELLQNLKGIKHQFFFSHRKPLPQCFEDPTNEALKGKFTHLWFVEDDMILPHNTLELLLKADKAVVTADYPVNDKGRGSVFEVDKRILFTGTGCLLVKREVFDELKPPHFRSDIKWTPKNMGDCIKFIGAKIDNEGYGLHDVNFGINLWRRGIPIHKIKQQCGQRKLIALGKAGSNDGAHQIDTWIRIKKNLQVNEIKRWPVELTGNLTTVKTPTGEMNVTEAHAKTLISKGLATAMPKQPIIIDDSEVL